MKNWNKKFELFTASVLNHELIHKIFQDIDELDGPKTLDYIDHKVKI